MAIDFWFTPSLLGAHGQRITSLNLLLPSSGSDELPLDFCERHGKSTDKVATRITLRGIGSFALFFSSSSRRDFSALGSGSRHSWRKQPAEDASSSPRSFASFHEAEKRSRVPALILLSHSSVIPAPIEAPIDGMPARSSLSISWRLFNSRMRTKNGERIGRLRRTGHSTHWIIFTPSVQRVSLLLTTYSLLFASQMCKYFSDTVIIYFSIKEIQ